MRELSHIRTGLEQLGFDEFQRDEFRLAIGGDGLERGVQIDLFRDQGRRRAKITVGLRHREVERCLTFLFCELGEEHRARLIGRGLGWLLANDIDVLDVEHVTLDTRQGLWAPSYSVRDKLRDIESLGSLPDVIRAMSSDRWSRWTRRSALQGFRMLVAIRVAHRQHEQVNQRAEELGMRWVLADSEYARLTVSQIGMVIDRAISR
ncbi:MAG: hypothetical protein WDM79_14895 [Terricaulis sp.]